MTSSTPHLQYFIYPTIQQPTHSTIYIYKPGWYTPVTWNLLYERLAVRVLIIVPQTCYSCEGRWGLSAVVFVALPHYDRRYTRTRGSWDVASFFRLFVRFSSVPSLVSVFVPPAFQGVRGMARSGRSTRDTFCFLRPLTDCSACFYILVQRWHCNYHINSSKHFFASAAFALYQYTWYVTPIHQGICCCRVLCTALVVF